MSDFEKDKDLAEKYSGVMGSIADDIRQINLDEKTEERRFDFEADAESDGGIKIEMPEAETAEEPEVVIEAETAEEPEGAVIEVETAEEPEGAVIEAETADEPEAVIEAETADETEGAVIEAETAEETESPAIEAETADETESPAAYDDLPDGSFDKFLASISTLRFDDEEIESGIGMSAGFDAAPIKNSEVTGNTGPIPTIDSLPGFESADSELDTLNCGECRDLLYDYVSDASDEDEKAAIEAHLKNCENCRMEYYEIKDMIGVLNNAATPEPPADLLSGIRGKLEAAAPEVKAERAAIKAENGEGAADKLRGFFETVKDKTDYVIKHANWRIVAPAALSAVLVLGVAGSGLYQVMKSSDEIYNFSDNAAIADARATAKPSSSGLDEYVTDDKDDDKDSPSSTSRPGATARPSTAATPKPASGSTSAASPKATSRPSSSSALPMGSSSSSKSTTSSGTTSRTTTSSSTTSRTTTSATPRPTTSSSTVRAAAPTPTPTKTPYVTPKIILPDIATGITSPTYVAPDSVTVAGGGGGASAPDTFTYTEPEAQAASITIPTVEPKAAPTQAPTAAPKPTEAPKTTATPKPSTSPSPSGSPGPSTSPGPKATLRPGTVKESERKRNSSGETEEYAKKSADMDKASVISCEIKDKDTLDEIMNSGMADCSKIDKDGAVTLYFSKDDYPAFTEYLKEKNLDYTLVSLGSGDDVKVMITDSTKKTN